MAKKSKRAKSEPVTYKGSYWCSDCEKERDLSFVRRPLNHGMVPAWHKCPACGEMCFFRMVYIENLPEKEAA